MKRAKRAVQRSDNRTAILPEWAQKMQAALIVAARAIVFATEPTFVVAAVSIVQKNGIWSGLTACRFIADTTSRTALDCANDQRKCEVRSMLAGSLAVPLARNATDDRLLAGMPNNVVRLATARCDLLSGTTLGCQYGQLLLETASFLRETETSLRVRSLASYLERFDTIPGDLLENLLTDDAERYAVQPTLYQHSGLG